MVSLALVLGLAALAPQDVDEKSSPFDGMRWKGGQPEVRIEGAWYEPVAIDGVAVEEILVLCDSWSPGRVKRFAEDLVPVLVRLGWDGDRSVDLDLRSLEDGSAVRIEGVEMTRDKRDALRDSSNAREAAGARRPSTPARIPAAAARRDIEAFGAGLEDQFAYLGLGDVDLDRELDRIREGLSADQVGVADLARELHQLLMRFGDGHAGVRAAVPPGRPGDAYLPFLLVESSAGVVAVLPDRSALVEPAAPVVRAIDGRSMGEWLELGRPFVANGSPQLVRRRVLGDMREIDMVRRVAGLEAGGSLHVTFSAADGSGTVERELQTSPRRPTYGDWPRSRSALLDGDVGYLRITEMNDEVEELRESMERFTETKGLIVDVRGNGGGSRELLLALGGYLIGPDEPAVVGNVAQYRRSPRFGEDHLEARYMHRADWSGWSDRQREAIQVAAAAFEPEWQPVGEFSAWHYLVVDRTGHPGEYFYDEAVVVLSDSGCFSATDIFLGALELLPRVTLLGAASSGGSARTQSFRLPSTGMEVRCASMASFRPDGRLYDGRGVEVDVEVLPVPEDFLYDGGDAQLAAALARFGVVPASGGEDSEAGPPSAGETWPALAEGIVRALAADDFEAFKEFTALGLKKEGFKRFIKGRESNRKALEVWDPVADDFRADFEVKMGELFEQIRSASGPWVDRDAQEVGFDWSGAKVSECEGEGKAGGDGGALVVSGSVAVYLRMDDCFMTPQGLLMFDAPQAYFGPREALEQSFRRIHR